MEDELTSEQRDALNTIKASRGACPSADTLLEYGALNADARATHAAHDHISTCSRCQLVLLHTSEPETASSSPSSSPLQWMLPIAAVLVIGVAGILFRNGGTSTPPVETIRGTEVQGVAPLGSVDALTEFSWQSPIRADRYRVRIMRGSDQVWSGETTGLRLAAPVGVLEEGVEYRWTVEAIDHEGEVRMTSPSYAFRLRQ